MGKIHICDICGHTTEISSHLTQHLAGKHNIGVIWEHCTVKDCDKKFKSKQTLKNHLANIHDIGVVWKECYLCPSKFKQKGDLTRHLRGVHSIGVKFFKCSFKECSYTATEKYNLDNHLKKKHRLGEKKYKCDQDECDFETYYADSLKTHKATEHYIDIEFFYCPECCDFFKRKHHLQQHLASIHKIGVKKFICDICGHEFGRKDHLGNHMKEVHSINCTFYYCDQLGCPYKTKRKYHVERHLGLIHDIGERKCDFCFSNCYYQINHKDKAGTHKVCSKCYNTLTGKNTRVEHIWSDYLDKTIGKEYLLSSDKSLKSVGGCSLKRPDKLYTSPTVIELDECDENQHLYNNGSYECEDKRISEIYDEEGISGKKMIIIRWNPDNYTPPDGYEKKKRIERLELHAKLKMYLRENPPTDLITIYYMFYNMDNPRISKSYPVKMIYDEIDVVELCT